MHTYILSEKTKALNYIFFSDSRKGEGCFSFFLIYMVEFSLARDFFCLTSECGHTKVLAVSEWRTVLVYYFLLCC